MQKKLEKLIFTADRATGGRSETYQLEWAVLGNGGSMRARFARRRQYVFSTLLGGLLDARGTLLDGPLIVDVMSG